jgi:alkanesulfonate monooxygenase SsuD/methylene tetrahydromethanopterin reductase-like flavin-dependent oxidoreductase (luciferase family)
VTREIRFGVVSESVLDGPAWADHARRVEDAGVDSLLIRDHFSAGAFGQQLAPFSALAAAAAVTGRLRVGTMVLSNDFRHPAIVAHEAASLHHLSGGRFELGIGAGWYQPEYSAAGIAFDRPGQRIDRLEESLAIIRGLLAGGPVHHRGTWYQIDGLDLTARRRSATEELIARRGWGGIDTEDVWQMPTIFIGSVAQIREDLQARRERFGLSYLITPDQELPTLAAIIAGS